MFMCGPIEKYCGFCVGHLVNISNITIYYYISTTQKKKISKFSAVTSLQRDAQASVPAL